MKKYLVSIDNAVTRHLKGLFVSEPDDAIALALLLDAHIHQELEITGIIASSGSIDSQDSYDATVKMVEMAGLRIPVIKGKGKKNRTEDVDYESMRNVINYGMFANDKTNLIGLGPLTDFAHLFRKYPSLIDRIGETYFVNTSFLDTTILRHFFSFNEIQDMESANFIKEKFGFKNKFNNSIFDSCISDEYIEEIGKIPHPVTIYVAENLRRWNKENRGYPIPGILERRGNMCPWDMVWVAVILEPKLFTMIRVGNQNVYSINDQDTLMQTVLRRLSRFAI